MMRTGTLSIVKRGMHECSRVEKKQKDKKKA